MLSGSLMAKTVFSNVAKEAFQVTQNMQAPAASVILFFFHGQHAIVVHFRKNGSLDYS